MRVLFGHRRPAASIVALALLVLMPVGSASAHTGLEFSDPADGATVTQPVSEVTVGFTSEVELVGNGFEALDPQGNLREPSVISDDDRVFTLLFDPPLTGGGVGIRFEVRARDGHVQTDSFSFVVDVAAPTTPPATSAPDTGDVATTSPATGAPAPEPSDPAGPGSTTSVVPTTTAPPTTAGTSTTTVTVDSSSDGSSTGIMLAIAAAAAIGVGGFFLIRSRTSAAP